MSMLIKIDEYITKLEWLKEWIALMVDGALPRITKGNGININYDAIPKSQLTPKAIMDLFYSTGVLFWQEPDNSYPVNFEEYCQFKSIKTT